MDAAAVGELRGQVGAAAVHLGQQVGATGRELELVHAAALGPLVLPRRATVGDLALERCATGLLVAVEVLDASGVVGLEDGATVLGLAVEVSRGPTGVGGFALGEFAQLGDLALDRGAQCVGLADRDRARLGGLGDRGPADRRGFVAGVLRVHAGFGAGTFDGVGGLGAGTGEFVRGTGAGVLEGLAGLGTGFPQRALGLGAAGRAQALGIDVGLADQPGRLFLGDTQGGLESRAESAVRGGAGFVELALHVRDPGLQQPDLLRRLGAVVVRLDEFAAEVVQRAVDVVLAVAPQLDPELCLVVRHVSLPLVPPDDPVPSAHRL